MGRFLSCRESTKERGKDESMTFRLVEFSNFKILASAGLIFLNAFLTLFFSRNRLRGKLIVGMRLVTYGTITIADPDGSKWRIRGTM